MLGPINPRRPIETLYISTVTNSFSDKGLYYFKFLRTYVGEYNMYIRVREEKAPIYPIKVIVYTIVVNPMGSELLTKDYHSQIAGVQFSLQV
jgi:hypothetical protein